MNTFHNMLKGISNPVQSKINKFCEPLFTHFGIKHFWYQRTTLSGHYVVLGNCLPWMEYVFDGTLYKTSNTFHHPHMYTSGIVHLPSIEGDAQKLFKIAREKFNINFSLLFINANSNYMEGFGFAINTNKKMHHQLLLNEVPLLRFFCDHFRKENAKMFNSFDEHGAELSREMGHLFKIKPNIMLTNIDKRIFLNDLGLLNVNLSKREDEVLFNMLDGYTTPELAKKLFISQRTVEHHIERIKIKLDCDSKSNLIKKARQLERIGYFI